MRPTIESLQNERIKQVVRLRDAAVRRKQCRFLIDGWNEIELASQQGVEIDTLFFDGQQDYQRELQAGSAARLASTLQPVSAKVLERISYGQRDKAPVAVAVTPRFELSQIVWQAPQIFLVLDRTEKPGNLGACLRTAAAAGAAAVILTDPICEPCNPNTIRASRGSLFTIPLAVTTQADFATYCQQWKLPCFAARVDARTDLWELDFKQGGALIFGNEAHGLDDNWCQSAQVEADARVKVQSFIIPMRGSPDSLNLSISAAVTLYEAVRQQSSI